MSHDKGKLDLGASDTNWSGQSQQRTRSLKFWIHEEERLYYLCGEKQRHWSAVQLYCTADLLLCRRKSDFLMGQLISHLKISSL